MPCEEEPYGPFHRYAARETRSHPDPVRLPARPRSSRGVALLRDAARAGHQPAPVPAPSLGLGDIVDVGIQSAEALEYSHVQRVVHRDIKPDNVVVSEEAGGLRVRVMDFGLARAGLPLRPPRGRGTLRLRHRAGGLRGPPPPRLSWLNPRPAPDGPDRHAKARVDAGGRRDPGRASRELRSPGDQRRLTDGAGADEPFARATARLRRALHAHRRQPRRPAPSVLRRTGRPISTCGPGSSSSGRSPGATTVLSTLGIALLVSTLVQNQQEAMMAAAFGAMVPMMYLSGLIPIENMPRRSSSSRTSSRCATTPRSSAVSSSAAPASTCSGRRRSSSSG